MSHSTEPSVYNSCHKIRKVSAPIESQVISDFGKKENCVYKIVEYENGDKYNGECYFTEYNGRYELHGKGIMTYSNGYTYDGFWRHGKRNNIGSLTYNGITIRYMNNIQQIWKSNTYRETINTGFGKYIDNNKIFYEGEFENGLRNGFGTMHYWNGNIYIGMWKNGLRHGKGIMVYANNDIYDGEWINNTKSGYGKQIYCTHNIYIGNWYNNMRHGEGEYIDVDHCMHIKKTGKWNNNSFEYGKITFPNLPGITYIGEGLNDFSENVGQGTINWFGDIYKGKIYSNEFYSDARGCFYDNKKRTFWLRGCGKIIWKSGTTFTGSWNRGKPDGKGILIIDKYVYEGTWCIGYMSKDIIKKYTWHYIAKSLIGTLKKVPSRVWVS
jgi:hypothetical protein